MFENRYVSESRVIALEFHQLDRRYEHLRVRNRQRLRRLLASLAESGQQTPIVVVAVSRPPPGPTSTPLMKSLTPVRCWA